MTKTKSQQTILGRERVLKAARKNGRITHKEACRIGKWDQAQYHLQALAEAGLLKHDKYNNWIPTGRKRPLSVAASR